MDTLARRTAQGLGRYFRVTDGRGESSEVRDETLDVGLIVLHRDQPLLDFPPGRQEHSAVVLEEPVRVTERILNAAEAAEIPDRPGREHHAALRAHRHDP